MDQAETTRQERAHERDLALITATTQIVTAAIDRGQVMKDTAADFVTEIYSALAATTAPAAAPLEDATRAPAVPVKKSVSHDFIICLEDGKKFKSLKRHIMTHYGLTPDQYRQKWGLEATYPMVAPAYAAARSQLAKDMGLGRKPASRH